MSSERPDHDPSSLDPADPGENGVLSDAASIDTTGIGILGGATAQVRVSMPGAEHEFDDDDELIDGAIVADEVEIVRDEDVWIEGDDQEPDAVAPEDESVLAVDAVIDDDGDVASSPEPAEPDDESEDVANGEAAEDEAAEDEDVVDEPAAAEPAAAEPAAAEPAAAEPGVGEPGVGEPAEAEVAIDDVVAGQVDALEHRPLPEHADEATPAAVDETPPAAAAPHIAPERPAEIAAEIGAATPPAIPTSRREAHHTGPISRTHEVERAAPPRRSVALTSKRLGEFDADRESADLLTADRLLDHGKLARPEPEGAWQHFVFSISGGRINLGDGRRARARKQLDRQIAAPLSGGARFVPVLSRKGGVGKTTVTALLGMALADARDDRIIAVDANPDRGTLAERLQRPSGKTVRDLVRTHDDVTGYNDISTIVSRDETRLDVLASDADPRVSEAFSDRDYEDVAEIAAHYYSIVLTDTGTGIVHSVMSATLGLADQLVIVSGLSVDEARLASETLTWLETNGFDRQVRNAVVVLNNSRPGAPLVRQDELQAHFGTRVRAVVRMPYDPHIATGSAIVFRDLQTPTRAAARELAVAVVEGLRSTAVAA